MATLLLHKISKFSREEDVALIGAYCLVCSDPRGTNFNSTEFWSHVQTEYRTKLGGGRETNRFVTVQLRVSYLKQEVLRYVGCIRPYFINMPAGWNPEDVVSLL